MNNGYIMNIYTLKPKVHSQNNKHNSYNINVYAHSCIRKQTHALRVFRNVMLNGIAHNADEPYKIPISGAGMNAIAEYQSQLVSVFPIRY